MNSYTSKIYSLYVTLLERLVSPVLTKVLKFWDRYSIWLLNWWFGWLYHLLRRKIIEPTERYFPHQFVRRCRVGTQFEELWRITHDL